MDRRTRRTRHAICEAFNALLSQKKYSAITVQEIIDQADIGRSTFYAHFATKEELLREVCMELFAGHIFPSAPQLPGRETELKVYLEELFRHTLDHLGRDGKMIRSILAGEGRNYFIACFREYMDELTERYILQSGDRVPGGVDRQFFKNHISGSFVEAVQWWFESGSRFSAWDVAEQYVKLIAPLLEED